MRNEVAVDPELIAWALSRAELRADELLNAFPALEKWLDGTKRPTLKQLEKFARRTYTPLGYLFLNAPPIEIVPIPFFRTLNQPNFKITLNVMDTILLVEQRQDWLREYLQDNEFEPLLYVSSFKDQTDIQAIVTSMRTTLGLPEGWAQGLPNFEAALTFLSNKIEDAGIIINFNGVFANNTSRPISVEDCRGFVIVDDFAPFMFINNSDSKAAQMFTIAHELAHIWLGESAAFDFNKILPANNPVEVLCDKIAAEFLVPEDSLNAFWARNRSISEGARHFKVSEIVFARRALDIGKIARQEFFDFYEEYTRRDFAKRQNRGPGGNFYDTVKWRLSLKFAAHVNNALKSDQLLYKDAYRLTGMNGKTYDEFITRFF